MKRLLSLSLCLMTAMLSFAHDFESGGIYYWITSSSAPYTVAVTYRGTSYSQYSNEYTGEVTIPESVSYGGKTYSVTSIGWAAFSGCSSLTSIEIPNSVTGIGDFAFGGCTGLTSITIPNSVTSIGRNVFEGTAWYDNQPNGLVYAGKVAYKYKGTMPDNTAIVLEEGTTGIAGNAFYNCSGLTTITIPNSVTTIGDAAFFGCYGLTSITIPNSVTTIGGNAFYSCSGLTSITIPNSVTSIGDYAFSGCSGLKEITSYIQKPFQTGDYCWDLVNKSIPLYVPAGSKEKYQGTDGWKEFTNIQEVDMTGIEAVAAKSVGNADITAIYDLNGRRRTTIQPGVNIVKKSDGTTRKVIKR